MSKCSECNQVLPELRPVVVAVYQMDSVASTASIECRAHGREDRAAAEALVHSGYRLMLVTEEQVSANLSSDWTVNQLMDARNRALDAEQKVEGLRKRNAELVRKLDDVRRTARL